MKILAALLATLALTACTDAPGNSPEAKVRNCIRLGGRPSYTTDLEGNVVTFLGCKYGGDGG